MIPVVFPEYPKAVDHYHVIICETESGVVAEDRIKLVQITTVQGYTLFVYQIYVSSTMKSDQRKPNKTKHLYQGKANRVVKKRNIPLYQPPKLMSAINRW